MERFSHGYLYTLSHCVHTLNNKYHSIASAQLESCLPVHESLAGGYAALLDGTVLHKIWLQIDPEPQHHPQRLDTVDDLYVPNARAKNFDCICKNLKCLFEEELDQTVLVLPDCAILGHSPGT